MSSFTLLQKLTNYCDNLIGENPESKPVNQLKTKKQKKEETSQILVSSHKKKTNHTQEGNNGNKTDEAKNKCKANSTESLLLNIDSLEENLGIINKVTSIISERSVDETSRNLVTDDGFKIVSSIPEDDSDISDAFESDAEGDYSLSTMEEESEMKNISSGGSKTTEDGYKIISDIPPDDSDVSDAFTDDEDYNSTGEEVTLKKRKLGTGKQLDKPFLQLIDEFGLDESFLKNRVQGDEPKSKAPVLIHAVKKSNKKKKKSKIINNTSTLASRLKPNVAVTVYDYATKRGPSQKQILDEENSLTHLSREELEKQIKSMRFDIYKLGMTGFNKKKKKQTRTALAVKLGAVPRKKGVIKYNELLVQKKKQQAIEKAEREMDREMGIENKKKVKKNIKGKKKPRAYSSQVGKFKDGVLSLSRKDLAKIKKS